MRCLSTVDMFVTLLYMLLQLRIQTENSFLSCLFLRYGKLLGVQNLLPCQSENVRDSGATVCDLPPLCVNVSDSGVKVGDLPPLMSGGYRCVVFC